MRINISDYIFVVSFLCISLVSCLSKRISVTGIAKNDKNIATVVTKTQQYFLDGLHHWDTNFINKKITVTGTLLVSKYNEDTLHESNYGQRHNVDMYYLLKPKWKLVK